MSNQQITIGSSAFTALCEKHISKSKLWNNKRLYIHCVGYNTKKCKQSLWIDLSTFTIHANTECDSQPDSWCSSQTEKLLDSCNSERAFARLLRILCAPRTPVTIATIEQVMQEAVLEATELKGYYTEWRNVRIAINRFGKLADRNRMFITFCNTTKANAPRNFVELTESEYAACTAYYRNSEKMCEPYTEASVYINAAVSYAEIKKEQNLN